MLRSRLRLRDSVVKPSLSLMTGRKNLLRKQVITANQRRAEGRGRSSILFSPAWPELVDGLYVLAQPSVSADEIGKKFACGKNRHGCGGCPLVQRFARTVWGFVASSIAPRANIGSRRGNCLSISMADFGSGLPNLWATFGEFVAVGSGVFCCDDAAFC
jgi:hypothetical protein